MWYQSIAENASIHAAVSPEKACSMTQILQLSLASAIRRLIHEITLTSDGTSINT